MQYAYLCINDIHFTVQCYFKETLYIRDQYNFQRVIAQQVTSQTTDRISLIPQNLYYVFERCAIRL